MSRPWFASVPPAAPERAEPGSYSKKANRRERRVFARLARSALGFSDSWHHRDVPEPSGLECAPRDPSMGSAARVRVRLREPLPEEECPLLWSHTLVALETPLVLDAKNDLSDLIVIGLTMNIVGTFFLANSIVFKRPRRVIEEFFQTDPGSLLAIRDYIFTKIQVVIGFLFLFCGFGLMIIAHVDKLKNPTPFLLISIGVLMVTALLIGTIGFAYSRRSFKRHLKEFFKRHPWPFDLRMDLTKEIGELFGVKRSTDETVEIYVAKLRRALQVKESDAQAAGRKSSSAIGVRDRATRG